MLEPTVIDLRLFDAGRDFAGLATLINEVNASDDFDWRPSIEEIKRDFAAPHGTFNPDRDAVVVEVDGRIVAAGWVVSAVRGEHVVHDFDVWVHPDERRRKFGRRVISWLEARARASVADGSGGPVAMPHVLGGGLITTNTAAAAFAAAMGYATIRYGFQMRRPLDLPIPDVALPDGLEIRPVLPEHHRAIWDADVEAFEDHWEARVRTDVDFERTFTEPDFDPSIWQVAWAGDEVAGSIFNTIYREQNERTGAALGWLDHVSVRRPWRGQGLAGALIARSLRIHRDRGMTEAALGVDAENPTGALRLYEKFGFRPKHTWAIVRKPF